jgi:membrane-associated phospholipid phosphatase
MQARQDRARAPAAGTAGVVAQRLADGLARRGGPARRRAAAELRELGAVDRAVYSAVAATPTPSLDEPLRRLSEAANNSRLWLAVATGLRVVGGQAGRRAAMRGTVAIGVTSALVNLAVKSAWPRQRPDPAAAGVPVRRNVRMPASTSFPSGHAASGFAFAAAIGRDQPWLGLALRFLAAAVAYSRVHTGVHYPGDAVVGALIGEGTGQAVAGLMDRLPSGRRPSRSRRGRRREPPDGADAEGAVIPAPGLSQLRLTAGAVTAVFQVLAFGGVMGQADRAFIGRDGLLFPSEPVQQVRTGGSGRLEAGGVWTSPRASGSPGTSVASTSARCSASEGTWRACGPVAQSMT